jgi:hypothetical protein
MGNIFISYSHKDSKYVRKLAKDIKQKGFDVWIDERIDYGTEWPKVIQERLDECEAFIVVASESSFESKWVQNEVARAQRKGKPFFPILLSGDSWLSTETTQYVDVRGGKLPPIKFYERLSSVVTKVKKESTQPPDEKVNLKTATNSQLPSESRKRFPFLYRQHFLGIPVVSVALGIIAIFSILATFILYNYLPFNEIPLSEIKTVYALGQTAVAQTATEQQQLALAGTPTISPNLAYMVHLINSDLSSASTLERTIDSQYYLTNASILNIPSKTNRIALLNVNCICMNATNCCSAERSFTVIVEAMKRNFTRIPLQEFDNVGDFIVASSNDTNKKSLGAVSASWQVMHSYFKSEISDYQLGIHVIETAAP